MELRKQSHYTYRCEYHIVWITRYRYKVLTEGVKKYLQTKLEEIIRRYIQYQEKEDLG
jgi:putative transposase